MAIVTNQKEKVFLTEEELKTLRDIQSQTKGIILELGEIQVMKLQLETREKNAKSIFEQTLKKENDFTQLLLKTYGTSELNPETGEIIKSV
jgi:hypothetical protein|tara:strand:- start:2306 stop:2578 length:273 start_codon:yes stop_codon:yes gene_type:complete